MKIVFLTGSHPRHAHMARAVRSTGWLAGLVIEEREDHVPAPPDGLSAGTRALFVEHFRRREVAEHRFFGSELGDVDVLAPEVLRISREALNGPRVHAFLRQLEPDLVLSYGVHKLSPETLSFAKRHAWNIHGGLSPWYRGVITHFWPSYMLEPQMTGMTLHETTSILDAGSIVHQTAVTLTRGDGVQDVSSRCVSEFAAELPAVLAALATSPDGALPVSPQGTLGKLWRGADWRPEHLRLVYDLYEDRLVDRLLDAGPLPAPKLVRVALG
jgi:folate-dependent phosphoribosylglycinamide formyltransferase PurN